MWAIQRRALLAPLREDVVSKFREQRQAQAKHYDKGRDPPACLSHVGISREIRSHFKQKAGSHKKAAKPNLTLLLGFLIMLKPTIFIASWQKFRFGIHVGYFVPETSTGCQCRTRPIPTEN